MGEALALWAWDCLLWWNFRLQAVMKGELWEETEEILKVMVRHQTVTKLAGVSRENPANLLACQCHLQHYDTQLSAEGT